MGSPSRFSRRAFIGMAAGAAAIPAVTAGCESADSGGAPKSGAGPAASRRGPVPENSLPGDPRWDIRHVGGPDAMMGYAGQASVLPGEPVTAVRVDDRALVHGHRVPDGLVPRRPGPDGVAVGHRDRPQAAQAGPGQADQHGRGALGSVAHDPHPRLARGQLPAAAGLRGGPAAVRPGHRPVGEDRGQDRDQELGGDLAGLQHVGRLRPVQRAGRDHRLQQPRRWRSAWTGPTTGRAPTCSCTTSGS